MNFKTTYTLFTILVAMLGLFLLSQLFGHKAEAEVFVLPTLHESLEPTRASDIATVRIDRFRDKDGKPLKESLVFLRNDKGWRLQEPEVRVQSFMVDQVVNQVIQARRDESADVTSNLAKFGLDNPSEVITIGKKGGDREWKINLGNESIGGDKGVVYVTSSDNPALPLAVKRSDVDSMFKSLNDFRSRDLLTENSLNVTYLGLQEPNREPIVLEKSGENKWRFQKPLFGEAELEGSPDSSPVGADKKNITGVRDLLNTIEKIKVEKNEDFVADNVKDMAKYGLDAAKPELLRIDIKQRESTLTGADDKKEPTKEALLLGKKADTKEEMYFARLESENTVVRVSAKDLDSITKVIRDPAVLRNRDLVQIDQSKIDAVDIKSAAGQIELRKPAATWKIFGAISKPGRDADNQPIQDLLTALNRRRQVVSFPDPAREGDLGFNQAGAVVISLWSEGLAKEIKPEEKKEEKKPEPGKSDKKPEKGNESVSPKLKDSVKPVVTLTFGRKDNDVVFVKREVEGEKTLLSIPQALLTKVSQGPLAYLERTIPSYSENTSIAKLTLSRSGETYEVEREIKDGKPAGLWKVKLPKTLDGRIADSSSIEAMIRDLRELRPARLISESPPENELKNFGLEPAPMKAVVSVLKDDKKLEDWVYSFGREIEDHSGFYAKQNKSDFVFVAPSSAVKALQGELLDPTVFHFDMAKVKEIKVNGWKAVVGFSFALAAEHKADKSWVAKTPADFDLSGPQVESFLTEIAHLKADHFLPQKTGPAGEHKLGDAERSLQVEIIVEGEKTPQTLTIGALNTVEKAYYAKSSSLPGDVFLISQAHLEKWLIGPRSLTKAGENQR